MMKSRSKHVQFILYEGPFLVLVPKVEGKGGSEPTISERAVEDTAAAAMFFV